MHGIAESTFAGTGRAAGKSQPEKMKDSGTMTFQELFGDAWL